MFFILFIGDKMTKEQIQVLVEFCKNVISDIKSDAVAHEDEIVMSTLKVFEIALSTLTAQPVKLPVTFSPAIGDIRNRSVPVMRRDATVGKWVHIEQVISAIREAGHEVQE